MEYDPSIIRETTLPSIKKLGLLGIAILLFVVGFYLAPQPLNDGNYETTISYNGSNPLSVTFTMTIDSNSPTSPLIQVNSSDGDYILSVAYSSIVNGQIDQKILFKATLFKSGDQVDVKDITNFNGIIKNGQTTHKISATALSNQEVLFNFRVFKFTNFVFGMLLTVSFLWLTELVPLAATSLLIPAVLVVFNIETATESLSQFANPIIFLFLAGFLLGEAMIKSGLDRYISIKMLSLIPANPIAIMISLMSLSAIFSMWMSNTAAAAVLIPLSIKLADNIGLEDNKYKRALVLSVAYSATIGGIGSLIGTPPNIIAVELLHEFDPTINISFAEWFLFGLPVVIIMVPITFIHLWLRFKPTVPIEKLQIAKANSVAELREHYNFSKNQAIVSVIFVMVFILWLTEQFHGISASIIAIMGAVALYFTGQIDETDLNDINWNALITFGGGLTLGSVIIKTGLADWLAMTLGVMDQLPTIIIFLLLGILALVLTAVASNTASAAILIPIVMPLGNILGLNPIVAAIYVAIVCSIDFAIVIGTPPTMVAYSTKLFKVKEIFQIGILLDLIGLFVTSILAWLLFFNFTTII